MVPGGKAWIIGDTSGEISFLLSPEGSKGENRRIYFFSNRWFREVHYNLIKKISEDSEEVEGIEGVFYFNKYPHTLNLKVEITHFMTPEVREKKTKGETIGAGCIYFIGADKKNKMSIQKVQKVIYKAS